MDLTQTLKTSRETAVKLIKIDDQEISAILNKLASKIIEKTERILKFNKEDLKSIDEKDPLYDRVLLTPERIEAMAASIREIAGYNSPLDIVLEEKTLSNGLNLKKVSVPIGVIGVIFEARPNVVIDIFTLCFKSKNVCVLKGGSKSEKSNEVLCEIIQNVIMENNADLKSAITLLPNDRDLIADFLRADEYIDMIIPRGGKKLIDFVRENSKVPVIETGAGVVHTFFDESGDLKNGIDIIFNAKTSRPAVCNALDTLLIHENRLDDLNVLINDLIAKQVEIRADERSYEIIKEKYPAELLKFATDEDFGTEFLSLKLSVKVVCDVMEAVDHINNFGSKHSEAIITENMENAEYFLKNVDAAAVYVNASTRFTDGGVFGLGAEVGISTQKLHARGPMGIRELTTYKWLIHGDGQVR